MSERKRLDELDIAKGMGIMLIVRVCQAKCVSSSF